MTTDSAVQEELELDLPDFFIWRELAVGGLVLMDLSWGALWIEALTELRQGETVLTVFLVLGTAMVGAHLLSRVMGLFRLKVQVQRAVFAAFFLGVILGGIRTLTGVPEEGGVQGLLTQPIEAFSDLNALIPAEFLIALAVLLFGWRGIRLAQEFIGPMKVFASFRLGFLMFLVYIALVTTLLGKTPGATWFVFLGAGLIALASSRVNLLALIRGGRRSQFNRDWFLGLTLAVGLAILLSTGVAILLSGVGGIVLGIVLRLLLAVLYLILYPLVYIVSSIFIWLFELLDLGDTGLTSALTLSLERLSDLFESLTAYASDYSWILEALAALWFRWGALVKLLACSSVIFLVGLVVVLQLRELRQRRIAASDELESEKSQSGVLSQLARAILGGLASRIPTRSRGRFQANLAAARVRQIYSDLADLSSRLGRPRRISQTPHEFLPDLEKVFVALDQDLDLITEAYIRVRYGELPEDEAEILQIEAAWSRVEAFGQRRLKAVEKASA